MEEALIGFRIRFAEAQTLVEIAAKQMAKLKAQWGHALKDLGGEFPQRPSAWATNGFKRACRSHRFWDRHLKQMKRRAVQLDKQIATLNRLAGLKPGSSSVVPANVSTK